LDCSDRVKVNHLGTRSIHRKPLGLRKVNLNHTSEQKIYLAFNQNKFANFSLTVAPAKKMRSARRAGTMQIEAGGLRGN
jgi:hypothetical protein